MKQYKFFKQDSSYRFEPERGDADSFTVDIKQRPIGENPFIFLSQDSRKQPNHNDIVLAAGRLSTSSSFKIYLGDPKCYFEEYDKSLPWEKMNIERPESTWSLDFPDSDLRRDFIWKKTRRIVVDGVERASRLWAQNWKLTSANDPDDVLAIFTGALGLSRGGTLQINMDWGVQFEHMVLITLVCQFSKHKQPASQSSGSSLVAPPAIAI
ncbi:unnamed protein product [Clonostachys rosea f. rosea IK726]|jgi:hypothetical protein|uniref:Uncharacterized protein n=2 Tax=Bionectria ochroleuca TaxID=29856 RepID=A0A8H7NPW7_BIOOC|nr:unnamed protein product [Clonostachys rosea f. rosea IK726]